MHRWMITIWDDQDDDLPVDRSWCVVVRWVIVVAIVPMNNTFSFGSVGKGDYQYYNNNNISWNVVVARMLMMMMVYIWDNDCDDPTMVRPSFRQ